MLYCGHDKSGVNLSDSSSSKFCSDGLFSSLPTQAPPHRTSNLSPSVRPNRNLFAKELTAYPIRSSGTGSPLARPSKFEPQLQCFSHGFPYRIFPQPQRQSQESPAPTRGDLSFRIRESG